MSIPFPDLRNRDLTVCIVGATGAVGEVLLGPLAHDHFLAEHDDLMVAARLVQHVENGACPDGIGLNRDVIEEQRAVRSIVREDLRDRNP